MPIKVMIPTALRQFADGQDTIDLEGADVGQVLGQLADAFPELKRHLFDDDGKLRNFVNVYVNDENIRDNQQQSTPLRPGDELTIVPAIAGGG
jgi:molybdopterin converting factor small subunit